MSRALSHLLFIPFFLMLLSPIIKADSAGDNRGAKEMATKITLEVPLENINLKTAAEYYVDLEDDAATLVVSFAQGVAGEALGDPDIYVRYEGRASTKKFDCISFSGKDYNEYCIIDQPEEGRYYIYVDAFEGAAVKDATLWVSTQLFPGNRRCSEEVVIRGQAMNEDDLAAACDIIEDTHEIFFDTFKQISPASMDPVAGDLNQETGINILSSLSNGETWAEYLTSGDNTSGIYYEVAPTEYYHRSTIWTFNGLEWTGGRTIYRSLDHEYIHALDGRYNKEGGYRKETGWWSEGLAEYLGTYHQNPYRRFEVSTQATQYTLAQIFDQHNNNGTPSPYSWGQAAVAFFMEEHPLEVDNMIGYMRSGNWEAWNALIQQWALTYQDEFAAWLSTKPRQQFENSAKSLDLNDFALVEGRGGWLFSVEIDEATDSLTFATTGGSGNVDMMVSAGRVPHWSFAKKPDCTSSEKNNEEQCTFTDVKPGIYYITLESDWAGTDILDLYVTACSGRECQVEVPPQRPLEQVVEPQLPGTPLAKTFQGCDLVSPYNRNISRYTDVSIENKTAETIQIYWINDSQGRLYLDRVYAEIAPNETYSAKNFWSIKDRIAVTDKNDKCMAVGVISRGENKFTFGG